MKFSYEIGDGNILDVQENFSSMNNPNDCEKVEFRVEPDGQISILANKEGWKYLARICVEMAFCAEKDPAYHIHKKKNLSDALVNGDEEVGFFIRTPESK